MGHFVGKEIDRLDLGEGFWVDIYRRMSYGMQQRLVAHFIKMTDLKTPDFDLAGGNIVLLELNITGWNLTNGDNQPVPVSKEAIENLEPSVAQKIAEEINRRNEPLKKA